MGIYSRDKVTKHKYNAQRTLVNGHWFPSAGESKLYADLLMLEKAGIIRDISMQEKVYLTRARVLFKPDFSYVVVATGVKEYAEFKGFPTPMWRLKRRLWQAYGPGLLHVYAGKGVLQETVKPSKDATTED